MDALSETTAWQKVQIIVQSFALVRLGSCHAQEELIPWTVVLYHPFAFQKKILQQAVTIIVPAKIMNRIARLQNCILENVQLLQYVCPLVWIPMVAQVSVPHFVLLTQWDAKWVQILRAV